MKAQLRSALFRAMVGASLGMLTGALLCGRIGLPPLLAVLSDGAYGAIVLGSTVLYGIEPWSLARSTICHLLITLAGFCALGLIQRWLSQVPLWMLLSFFATYFAIWLIQWMTCYRSVRRLNDVLRRRRVSGGRFS